MIKRVIAVVAAFAGLAAASTDSAAYKVALYNRTDFVYHQIVLAPFRSISPPPRPASTLHSLLEDEIFPRRRRRLC